MLGGEASPPEFTSIQQWQIAKPLRLPCAESLCKTERALRPRHEAWREEKPSKDA